jgi:hypothetical protein
MVAKDFPRISGKSFAIRKPFAIMTPRVRDKLDIVTQYPELRQFGAVMAGCAMLAA